MYKHGFWLSYNGAKEPFARSVTYEDGVPFVIVTSENQVDTKSSRNVAIFDDNTF
jgi:hypothetical protein